MREQGTDRNDLVERLASDSRLGLDQGSLHQIFDRPIQFVGAAQDQAQIFVKQVESIAQRYPEAANYQPEPML
jgi:adenylosuccinate lyase